MKGSPEQTLDETFTSKLTRGCWAIRRDGKHWFKLVPNLESHKLVRVCAGPGETIPSDVCWHLAIPAGSTVNSDRVWLHYGYFPCSEPCNEWRRATDAEVTKQEEDEKVGPLVFTDASNPLNKDGGVPCISQE